MKVFWCRVCFCSVCGCFTILALEILDLLRMSWLPFSLVCPSDLRSESLSFRRLVQFIFPSFKLHTEIELNYHIASTDSLRADLTLKQTIKKQPSCVSDWPWPSQTCVSLSCCCLVVERLPQLLLVPSSPLIYVWSQPLAALPASEGAAWHPGAPCTHFKWRWCKTSVSVSGNFNRWRKREGLKNQPPVGFLSSCLPGHENDRNWGKKNNWRKHVKRAYLFIRRGRFSPPLSPEARNRVGFSQCEQQQQQQACCERKRAPTPSITLKQVMRERQGTESESYFKVRARIDGSIDGICTPG